VRPRRFRAAIVAACLCAQILAIVAAGSGAGARPKAPPPTPVNGKPSPFQSELHTPADGTTRPTLVAPTALLADLDSGDVLVAKGAAVRRPIASVTKLMTALEVLQHAKLGEVVRVARDAIFGNKEYGASSTLGLRDGERQTVKDLLYGALLGSANDAARALAIHVAGSEEEFVRLMNKRARGLGMRETRFASATGLDDRGRSTAADLLVLVEAVLDRPGLAEIVGTRSREIPSPGGKVRTIQNRNVLLWLYPGATGMKTGSTAAAGWCLVATAQHEDRRLAAIVLGAPTEAFSDAAALLNYGFDGFTQRTLVTASKRIGSVRLRGGSVPVMAGESLDALVPTQDLQNVRFRFDVDPRAAFPPAVGDVVGSYRVVVAGIDVGTVPLEVAGIPEPADPGAEPWWVRAATAVAGAVGSVIVALF
jgi:serine-type D-Ala-D-Ala carboxypeptidase (penicillin-binding protein 5/6)